MELQRVRRPEGPQDWEAQRAVITDLYITKGLELEHLMEIMEEDHFFKATKKQYKTYFTKWDLRKNVRPSEYSAMIRKRRQREEEGRDSAFRLRGTLVDDSKIVRYEKKAKKGVEHEVDEAGTPDDLSCFTPSPVASSPSAPSPVLPPFSLPILVRVSTHSPFPRIVLIWSPRLLSLEAPYHGLHWRYSKLITSLMECDWESLKLNIRSRKSEIMDDIMDTLASQMLEDLKTRTICRRLRYFLPMFASWGVPYEARQLSLFRMIHLALLSPLLLLEVLARLKLAYPDSAIRKFLISLSISDITTTHDVGGGTSALDVSVALMGIVPELFMKVLERNSGFRRSESCDKFRSLDFFLSEFLVRWEKLVHESLKQKHNPPVRRSKSCESIKSVESFLSDPVIDWKELLYGCNR